MYIYRFGKLEQKRN